MHVTGQHSICHKSFRSVSVRDATLSWGLRRRKEMALNCVPCKPFRIASACDSSSLSMQTAVIGVFVPALRTRLLGLDDGGFGVGLPQRCC